MRLVQPNYSAYYNISACYTKFFITPFSLVRGAWIQNVGIILHMSVFYRLSSIVMHPTS
jgi:hypothetical protein